MCQGWSALRIWLCFTAVAYSSSPLTPRNLTPDFTTRPSKVGAVAIMRDFPLKDGLVEGSIPLGGRECVPCTLIPRLSFGAALIVSHLWARLSHLGNSGVSYARGVPRCTYLFVFCPRHTLGLAWWRCYNARVIACLSRSKELTLVSLLSMLQRMTLPRRIRGPCSACR